MAQAKKPAKASGDKGGVGIMLDASLIDANAAWNVRKHGDTGARDGGSATELRDSIKAQGLLQPILVRPVGARFAVVAGFRRFAACRELGMDSISCVVRNMSERDALIANGTENLVREDLFPGEIADLCHALHSRYSMSGSEIEKQVGVVKSYVNKLLSLREKLAPSIWSACMFTHTAPASIAYLYGIRDKSHEEQLAAFAKTTGTDLTIGGPAPTGTNGAGGNGAPGAPAEKPVKPKFLTPAALATYVTHVETMLSPKGKALGVTLTKDEGAYARTVLSILAWVENTNGGTPAPFAAKVEALTKALAAQKEAEKAAIKAAAKGADATD